MLFTSSCVLSYQVPSQPPMGQTGNMRAGEISFYVRCQGFGVPYMCYWSELVRRMPIRVGDMHPFASQTVAELLRDLGVKLTQAADVLR